MTTALRSSWKVLPIAVGLSALLGGFVAAFTYGNHGVAFPVSAVCSLAVLWVTAHRVRRAFPVDSRHAFTLAVGASGVTVFIATWVHVIHVRPAWVESTFSWRDRGEPPAWLVAPATVSMIALPLPIAVTESLATSLYRPLRRSVRVLLPVLAVALGVLSVVGVVRSASRSTPRSPVEGLPVVATLHAPRVVGVERHMIGPNTLTVACAERYSLQCHVLLQPGIEEALPPGWPTDFRQLPYGAHQESSVSKGATLEVLRDQRHDLWIVLWTVQRPFPNRHPVAAFRGPTLQRVNLGLRDFPGEFAPPIGWPIAALLGVALAAWFVRRARYVDAMPSGPLADATLGVDGTLLLADGSTHAAVGSAPAGPVVVAAATAATAPYRDGAPVDIVRVGTLAQWNDALRDERDVRYALAFSTLVLLGTPMAIAAGLRLLW